MIDGWRATRVIGPAARLAAAASSMRCTALLTATAAYLAGVTAAECAARRQLPGLRLPVGACSPTSAVGVLVTLPFVLFAPCAHLRWRPHPSQSPRGAHRLLSWPGWPWSCCVTGIGADARRRHRSAAAVARRAVAYWLHVLVPIRRRLGLPDSTAAADRAVAGAGAVWTWAAGHRGARARSPRLVDVRTSQPPEPRTRQRRERSRRRWRGPPPAAPSPPPR